MSTKSTVELQAAFTFAYFAALQYARRILPERLREDCCCDFRIFIHSKAGSDVQLIDWCRSKPALVRHCARLFTVDCARRYGYLREALACECADSDAALTEWTLPDCREFLGQQLNRDAFWEQLARICHGISDLSFTLIVLHYRDALSYDEISTVTGIQIGTVRRKVSRAIKHIHDRCDEEGITRNDLGEFIASDGPQLSTCLHRTNQRSTCD